jgi:hypothetical protein
MARKQPKTSVKRGHSQGKRLSKALAERLCAEVASGVPLTRACQAEGVKINTVFDWLQRTPELRGMYARACETRLQVLEERVLELCHIGHEAALDEMTGRDRLTAIKLEIDTLKWMLSKLMRCKYGEKSTVEITGKDGAKLETKQTLDMEAVQHVARLKLQMERMQREEEAEREEEHEQERD